MAKSKDWDKVLADLKSEISATEDEDEIKEILENYLRKIKAELV